jgi:D-xylose transport system substrate-binding protein
MSADDDPIKVGVSFNALQGERWNRELKYMQERAEQYGMEFYFQDANFDANLQNQQIENLITQKMDIIVVLCQDSEAAAVGVDAAHDEGIKTVSYVRTIETQNVDGHIGSDFVAIGANMAQQALDAGYDSGNFILLGGDPSASPAIDMHTGMLNVLQPLVDSEQINVVSDTYVQNWDAEQAMAEVENDLTKVDNDIKAILSQNGDMAGGSTRALEAQGLAGKVFLTGCDADLAACQRIVEGLQNIDHLFPSKYLGYLAMDAAVAIYKDDGSWEKLAQGKTNLVSMDYAVATAFAPFVTINKDNIKEWIIDSNLLTVEEVYANVPKDQWPTN